MDKIFTFGDGLAAGHLWPEWPQLLELLAPDYQIINTAAVGAGPEYLVHRLVSQLEQMADSQVIFQWPVPNRFDKLVDNPHWKDIISADPVYHFNTYVHGKETWWLTSAADNEKISKYHSDYIEPAQHKTRSDDYRILVKHTLKQINCQAHYITSSDQIQYSKFPRFKDIRQDEVQPSPPVHFYFLMESILPNTTINYSPDRAKHLEKLILDIKWQAYDPSRAEIWKDLVENLNSSNWTI